MSGMFGQQKLFGVPAAEPVIRFWVSAAWRRQAATTNLALAVARARAAAVDGQRIVILGVDGTAAAVSRSPDGGFLVIPQGPGSWPDQCRRLLEEHG